ncbi:MAG: vanadium-dependent haloperoxidase, partial [Planctomycetota bacterium]
LQSVATQQGNTLEENAALFAQASVAMADAGVVAWHTKFSEEFWRPVTAIQNGDSDGNDLTVGDPEWTALGAPDGGDDIIGFTPQFPTYISGHATFGGALFGALQQFYGTDDIAFEVASEELEILIDNPELQAAYGLDLDDATRSFDSFSEAMAENGRSRVYLGIHFDFDDTVGQEVGVAVAESVSQQFNVVGQDNDSGNRNPNGPSQRPMDNNGPNRSMSPENVDRVLGSDIF